MDENLLTVLPQWIVLLRQKINPLLTLCFFDNCGSCWMRHVFRVDMMCMAL
jgi:hypothetical protein